MPTVPIFETVYKNLLEIQSITDHPVNQLGLVKRVMEVVRDACNYKHLTEADLTNDIGSVESFVNGGDYNENYEINKFSLAIWLHLACEKAVLAAQQVIPPNEQVVIDIALVLFDWHEITNKYIKPSKKLICFEKELKNISDLALDFCKNTRSRLSYEGEDGAKRSRFIDRILILVEDCLQLSLANLPESDGIINKQRLNKLKEVHQFVFEYFA